MRRPRFSESRDGVKRATVRIEYRLSEEEWDKIQAYAKRTGIYSPGVAGVREMLAGCLDVGLQEFCADKEDDDS